MSGPVRIQLSRAKGWRMPENTVVVARPTKWGNPFASTSYSQAERADLFRKAALGTAPLSFFAALVPSPIVHELAKAALDRVASLPFQELRGKNLACWCKPGSPCHADVLLELANR